MPSGKGVVPRCGGAVRNAGQVNAIQSAEPAPQGTTRALGFQPPHDPGPRSETDLIDDDPALPTRWRWRPSSTATSGAQAWMKPLQCVPIVIKIRWDQRPADHGRLAHTVCERPAPSDGTLVPSCDKRAPSSWPRPHGRVRRWHAPQLLRRTDLNPTRPTANSGSSSTVPAAPSANPAVCGISGGSLGRSASRARSAVCGDRPTRWPVSRHGTWAANLCASASRPGLPQRRRRGARAGRDPRLRSNVRSRPRRWASTRAPLHSFALTAPSRASASGIVREFMPN
jgi:hypothetical protein